MYPGRSTSWLNWDLAERDAATGFDLVFPRWRGRHLGHRTRPAVPIDINLEGISIKSTWYVALTSEIWIPPWAERLVVPLVFSLTPSDTGTPCWIDARMKIGSEYGTGQAQFLRAPSGVRDADNLGGNMTMGGPNASSASLRGFGYQTMYHDFGIGHAYLDTVQTFVVEYQNANLGVGSIYNTPYNVDTWATQTSFGRPWRWEEITT